MDNFEFCKVITLEKFKIQAIITLEKFEFRIIITLDNLFFPIFVGNNYDSTFETNFIAFAVFLFAKNKTIMYYKRLIDQHLKEWASRDIHKPILLRGARQVGKSSAVRHLGKHFETFLELNLEMEPQYKAVFKPDLNVKRIITQISAISGKRIEEGSTLLFIDEIQECPEAIMSLRFFKENMPQLHVIAAGSLLEFALAELPTFGVGRIHSMFMYPMTFDEFLLACGEELLLNARNSASPKCPLPDPLHEKLISLIRNYMLIGGMPECVAKWVETHDYLLCQEIQDDILVSYEDDFPKYKKRADVNLLRNVLRSTAVQATKKFVYTKVGDYKNAEVKNALDLLILAGLLIPVTHTNANGLPLGSEIDSSYRKILFFDCGLMLRLLGITMGDTNTLTTQILTSTAADLVNKGTIAELVVGLEFLHYMTPNLRHELYYWVRTTKNSQAEIDYLLPSRLTILPIEVKAGSQGGMKSLWMFMRDKHLTEAVRCSLENFGEFSYTDKEDNDTIRHVSIYPLYAVSQIISTSEQLPQ